uniref:Replication-associated protein n=1 Tax=French bean severe leaf curl virus TaxID=1218727 RepID=J7FX61_9GEMI|nr:replication associated protein [French bean severe leaf curl virus]
MPRRNNNSFRLQGKSIFLTYPKCPLTPLFVIDYLYQLLKNFNPIYARVCTENHQDGEPHLHCLVQLDKRFNTTSQRYFDISDPNRTGVYHPNCQVPRRDADVADYIAKGGQFEERGILRASRRSPKKSRDSIWTNIINESTSKSEFLGRVQIEQPYVWATQLRNLEYAANSKWPEQPSVYIPKWTVFNNVPEPIREWADTNLFTVSLQSMQLVQPEISVTDMQWAHNLTEDFITDEWIGNSEDPVVQSFSGSETGPPSDSNNCKAQQKQAKQHGPGAWVYIIIFVGVLILVCGIILLFTPS